MMSFVVHYVAVVRTLKPRRELHERDSMDSYGSLYQLHFAGFREPPKPFAV